MTKFGKMAIKARGTVPQLQKSEVYVPFKTPRKWCKLATSIYHSQKHAVRRLWQKAMQTMTWHMNSAHGRQHLARPITDQCTSLQSHISTDLTAAPSGYYHAHSSMLQ